MTSSQYSFRKATPEDSPMISALAIHIWVDTYAGAGIQPGFGTYIERELSVFEIAKKIVNKAYTALLCFDDEKLVGLSIVGFGRVVNGIQSPAAELQKLYIHPKFKGRGIGKALFNRSFDAAVAAGFSSMFLSVYHGNHDAIAFYQRLGLHYFGDCYFEIDGQEHLNHLYRRDKD